jgi:hypothetical protein
MEREHHPQGDTVVQRCKLGKRIRDQTVQGDRMDVDRHYKQDFQGDIPALPRRGDVVSAEHADPRDDTND